MANMDKMNLETLRNGVDESIPIIIHLKGYEQIAIPYDATKHKNFIVCSCGQYGDELHATVEEDKLVEITYAVKKTSTWSIEKIICNESSDVLEANSKAFCWKEYKVLEIKETENQTFKED